MINLLEEASNVDTSLLFLILLGSSGAGKSHTGGTAPGPVLFLYFGPERHGVTSAGKSGNNIIAVRIDADKAGTPRKPDAAFKFGLETIKPDVLKAAGIKTVIIDGLSELEKLIRDTTTWADACLSPSGKHNNFAEPAATVKMLDQYLSALRAAQDKAGVHVVMNGILDVQEAESDGSVAMAKPRATGYSVAESVIQQFDDILVVGKVTKPDGTSAHALQTGADITRISTDDKKKVKRFINFGCRLSGVKELPPFIKADLNAVIALKTGGK